MPLLPEVATSNPARDMSWLLSLALPDMPVRWDARVVRYLSYYHDEPRGRSLLQGWVRKSGRYGATIRRVFRNRGLPDDLVWVALIESGFDPAIRSSAGAAGLWQLMPEGAKAFGLAIDRWIDERYDAERATEAAARYLADLHRRLGNWELALAAYNMGYGALLNAIRKYNTNDFWELTKVEAGVPYETALYVPKIIAVAVAARNNAAFGLDSVRIEPPLAFDAVAIPSGTSVTTIAAAAGVAPSAIEALNPQLRRGRTPPLSPSSEITAWTVRVPQGKGLAVSRKFAPRSGKDRDPELDDAATTAVESAVASAEPAAARCRCAARRRPRGARRFGLFAERHAFVDRDASAGRDGPRARSGGAARGRRKNEGRAAAGCRRKAGGRPPRRSAAVSRSNARFLSHRRR